MTNMIEVSSLETQLGIVQSGLAATLLPTSVLSGEFANMGSFSIPEAFRHTSTSLIRRNDRFRNKAFSAFAELVKVNFDKARALSNGCNVMYRHHCPPRVDIKVSTPDCSICCRI